MVIKLDNAIINVTNDIEYQIRITDRDNMLGLVLETQHNIIELIECRDKNDVWNDILELLLNRLYDLLENGDEFIYISRVLDELIHELYERIADISDAKLKENE